MAVLCVAPSCKEIVRDSTSRCEKHKFTAKKDKNKLRELRGGRRNSKVYDSSRWRRLSNKKRTVTPFCEMCEVDGVTLVADVTDHIIEIEDGGNQYEWDNLMSLCHTCHNQKTADEKRKRRDQDNKT